MTRCSMISFVVLIVLASARGFSSGPSQSACVDLTPSAIGSFGHANAVFEDLGFVITADPTFRPNEAISVTLSSTSNIPYEGIFLQVRNGESLSDSTAVGAWIIPDDNFQFVDCSFDNFPLESALGHNSPIEKATPQNFFWIGPDCTNGMEYYIKATVVETLNRIQIGISVRITCNNPDTEPTPASTTTTTTTQPPPTTTEGTEQTNECEFASLTTIPEEYNTSFEDGTNPFRGWIIESQSTYNWTANRGPTPSLYTGPPTADDGEYYIYAEASSPAQPGDTTVIRTNQDIRGCFCLRLAYSFIVFGADHSLALEVNGVERRSEISVPNQFSQSFDAAAWRLASIQFDSADFLQIRMIARRGENWIGDLALDSFQFIPGRC